MIIHLTVTWCNGVGSRTWPSRPEFLQAEVRKLSCIVTVVTDR